MLGRLQASGSGALQGFMSPHFFPKKFPIEVYAAAAALVVMAVKSVDKVSLALSVFAGMGLGVYTGRKIKNLPDITPKWRQACSEQLWTAQCLHFSPIGNFFTH